MAVAAATVGAVPMTRPLRRAHFRIWVILAVALYGIITLGLWARRTSTPVNPNFQEEGLP